MPQGVKVYPRIDQRIWEFRLERRIMDRPVLVDILSCTMVGVPAVASPSATIPRPRQRTCRSSPVVSGFVVDVRDADVTPVISVTTDAFIRVDSVESESSTVVI